MAKKWTFHPADHRQSLAEVSLCIPGVVAQRDEYLPLTLPGGMHVVLHDRQAATVGVLVAQGLKKTLRRMPLLPWTALIFVQDLVDDAGEGIQLGPFRWLFTPIPRRS